MLCEPLFVNRLKFSLVARRFEADDWIFPEKVYLFMLSWLLGHI